MHICQNVGKLYIMMSVQKYQEQRVSSLYAIVLALTPMNFKEIDYHVKKLMCMIVVA